MKENIVHTLKTSFEASIAKHKMNIDIMLNNPMAIHEHTDFMGAVELELAQIAEYEDKLEVLTKYFNV
jgi:hypothetical protein